MPLVYASWENIPMDPVAWAGTQLCPLLPPLSWRARSRFQVLMILPPTCILALSHQVPARYSLPQWLPVSLSGPVKTSLLSLPLILSFPFSPSSTPATRLSTKVSSCLSLFENPQSFPVTNRIESKKPLQSDPKYLHIIALTVSSPPPSLCLYSRHGFLAAPP